MIGLYPKVRQAKAAFIVIIIFTFLSQRAMSQCTTGCSSTVSTNSANITVPSGQTVCLTYAGTFTRTITLSGGTLCIGPNTTVSSALSVASSSTVNVYGTITGTVTEGTGTITVFSGGIFTPSSMAFTGGTFTNNGTATFPAAITIPAATTINSSGTLTTVNITNNSANVTLSGTNTINGSVTNNGTMTITGPNTTITGPYTASSGSVNTFSGGISAAAVVNSSTITLSGVLTVSGAYSGAGVLKAGASGCNALKAGSISGTGTYNGNTYGLAVSPAPACTVCFSNGAYTIPTQQPSGTGVSAGNRTVTGTFTSPSATISGYIVLRYIGSATPTDNPVNFTAYSVGSTIGSCTVVALVTSSTAGTETFTDALPASACGQTVSYRMFSYNGTGVCSLFYTTSPLTGSIAMPIPTATITPSGSPTVCSPATVTLTASGGGTYLWSNTSTATSISAASTGSYGLTVTGTDGCTASTSQNVTVNPAPTVTTTNGSICPGGTGTLTATGGGTYAWSGSLGSAATVYPTTAGTYTVTVTTAGCSTTASATATAYSAPTVTAGSNSPVATGSAINLSSTASGTAPYTYSWSGPSGYTASTQNPTISAASGSTAGTYTITVTDAHCSATASATVTEISPGGTAAGMSLWLKANTGVTNLLGIISSWNDQSGAGNNASTVNGVAPTLTTNSLNSYPVVTLPGTGGFQGSFGTSITSSTVTAFTVMQPQAGGNFAGVLSMSKTGVNDYDNVNGACLFFNDNSGNIGSYTNNNYCSMSPGAIGAGTNLFTTSYSASNDSFFTGGKFNSVGAYSPGPFNSQKFTVGDRYPQRHGHGIYDGQNSRSDPL